MPNSPEQRPLILFKDQIELQISSRSKCQANEVESDSYRLNHNELEKIPSEDQGESAKLSKAEEAKIPEEDDEGFKTPTSSDHKIPKIKQCPPAPRKPETKSVLSNTKRKVSSARRSLHFAVNLSNDDVESIFPSDILSDLHHKIKKTRRRSSEADGVE